ncbi:MAG: carbohydrate ABC transporter permease [Clostridiales bacterium]|jgi:sn-glycerol 3-phosphate transport system permease protein|nr:carbohydrate ABC transporter permease [Clostridiales bacterium]
MVDLNKQELTARRFIKYLKLLPRDLFKIIVMLLFAFPFYWMLITAFKTYGEAILTPPTLWPRNFTVESFQTISELGVGLWRYALNSVIVTLSIIAIQMVIMSLAAYAFAKRSFPLQGILFGIVMVAFMIPEQITYISVFLMMSRAKLINTLWPQILPFGANAFGIFLLRQGFKQIPDEIIESAKLDSASELQIITQIMLPMSKATMVTIAMFSFISHWNAYFWPLVMTMNDSVRPLTMAIERLRDAEQGLIWNNIMAANTILVVPVIIVFIFASKKIISAFAYRGMK